MASPSSWYIATASGMAVEDQARIYLITTSKPSLWRRILRRFGR